MKSCTSTLRALSLVLCFLFAFAADAAPVAEPGALPPPAISPAGPVTFCGRGTLTVGGYTGNPNFLWLNNNAPIPASNQSTHVVTASGNYACVLIYNNHNDTTTAVAVTVNAADTVTVVASPASICNGASTTLTATANLTGNTFAWSPAATLSAATGATVTATPTTTTQYQVIGTAPNGCKDTALVTVTVNPKPNASFTFNPSSGCPRRKRKFEFISTSTPSNGLTYAWNFGDPNSGGNNTSTGSNPQHSFIGTGFGTSQSFTVTLIVTTPSGCKDTASTVISVGAFPDAALEGTPPLQTYNGEPYFYQCDSSQHTFTFYNMSSTAAINTNYVINWGDASPNYTSTTWGTGVANAITHNYAVGIHQLTLYVYAGSCVDTALYNVFIGSNPGGSISSPSSTQGCTGTTFSFPFANVAGNSPGTDYYIYVNDGSDTLHYTQETLPSTFIHTFDSTSCGIAPNNTFTISYSIVNPCGETPGTIGGIRISKKAEADFTIAPNDTTCVGNIITLTNTSTVGSTVPNAGNGACTNGKTIWEITPAAGWTINSGSLGSNNSLPNNPDAWTSGTDVVQVIFNTPATYTIKIITGTTRCGLDTMTRTICVNPLPTAAFNLSTLTGCVPLLNVAATGSTNVPTCGQNTYRWTVTYAATTGCLPDTANYTFAGGTNATSQNPVFSFLSPGVYTINLQTIAPLAACSSNVVTQQVTVKGKPVVSISGVPANLCAGQSITPTQTSTCYIDAATTYNWTFTNGTPASANTASPGTIVYNTAGTQNISLAVTNTCGTTTANASLTVNALPTISGNTTICVNSTTTLSGSPTPASVNPWISSNTGVATINSSGVVTGISAGSSTITYTNSNGCTKTVSVTVQALPVISGTTDLCIGNTSTLTATGTPATSNPWTSSNPGVATVSNTGLITAIGAGSATITFTNDAGCSKSVTVTVSAAPTITGGTHGCIGASFTLSGSGTPSATTPWTSSNTGVATISNTGVVTGVSAGNSTITYTTSAGCVNTVTITIDPTPTITGPASLCAGSNITLSGSGTPATVSPWTSSNTTVATISNTGVVTGLSAGSTTITYTDNNGCRKTISIQVNALPSITGGTGVCVGASLTLTGSGTPSVTTPWTSSNTTVATISNTGVVSGLTTGTSIITYTDVNGCVKTQSISVNPIPAISGTKADPSGCSSTTGSITITGLTPASSYVLNYNYNTAAQPAINFTTGAAATTYVMNNLPSGTYSNITVTLSGCVSNPLSFTLIDPNPPQAPVTSAGPVICSGNNFTISIPTPVAGGTYNWTGPNSYSNTGTSITITNAQVVNGGTYQVTVTVNGCTSPATSVIATVHPTPAAPVVPNNVTYCQNATASALTATPLSGHTLLWYTAATGGTGSATAPTPVTTTPGTTTYYVSQISADNCEGPRAAIPVLVNPIAFISPITDTVCSSAAFSITPTVTTVPPGTVYSWAAPVVTGGLTGGTTGTNAATISGSLTNPTDFIQNAVYTVQPVTGTCAGADFTVTIFVNPAPHVNFNPANQTICSGQTSAAVTLSSATPNVSLPWTAVQPIGITGVTTSGSNTIPAQTLTNATTSAITVTYTAVAVTSGASACPGDTSRYTITVNPKPLVPAQTASVCSGDSLRFAPANNPPASIVPPGTLYTWTFTDNPNVSGETNQATAVDSVRQLLVNTTNIPQTVVYTVTPTSGAAGSCVGNPFQLTVTVSPTPAIPTLTDTICSGDVFVVTPQQGVPNAATIIPAGTTYSWSAPVLPPGISGAAAGTNAPNISGSLTNTTLAAATITYIVTPTSGISGNCVGQPFQVKITVKPRASVSNNPLNQSVCNGNTTTAVNWTSLSPGATYAWTVVSSGSVTGFLPNGNGPTLGTMTLTNTGIAQDSVVYAITSTASACAGAPTNYVIYVNPDAKASFAPQQDTACWPFFININNTSPQSTGNPNIPNGSYQWYATTPAGTTTFIGSGTIFPGYTLSGPSESIQIKMVAISAFGCKNDSVSHWFYTKPQPHAQFSMTTHDSCGPLIVAFTNQTNLIDTFQYNWNFGNGNSSTLTHPGPQTFLSSPNFVDTTYYVTLTAYNECDSYTYIDSVIIRANPKARFFVSSSSGCSPFTITVTNTSLGNATNFYWNFGDGVLDTTHVLGTLNHTYYTGVVDTFQLQLIAESPCGRDTMVLDIRVAPNIIQPGVSINAGELYGCVNHTVNFINSTTGATQFIWNWGDASPAQTTGLFETVVPHTYTAAGTYTVSIFMTNGCSDTTVYKTVVVYPRPVAAFATNQLVYCLGDTTRVINSSTGASNYIWNWGTGPTTAGFEPPHLYTAAGNFTILLTAQQTNSTGVVCFDTVSHPITILAKPDSSIVTNIRPNNCAPFTLTASATGITTETVTWYVYDTTAPSFPIILSGQNLQYTFNNQGTFEIHMVAQNAAGCKDSTKRVFYVYGKPVAAFSPRNLTTCSLDTIVSYINNSTANAYTPLTYQWLVDNALQATTGNFSYHYITPSTAPLPRIFQTSLIATNSVGCADTAVGTLQMNPTSDALFSMTNPNDCIPFDAQISNNSTYATQYAWYLNGSLVSNAANPVIPITQANTNYTIQLIVSNAYACRPDTTSFNFTSRVMPIAAFSINNNLGCTGQLNVVTTNNSQHANAYTWDWGDATAVSTSFNPTHLYTNLGQYQILLTASDGTCTDTTSLPVIVGQKPIVDFDADTRRTCDTATVHFINLTTFADSYQWVFSNGIRTTDPSPTVTFLPSNTPYTVQLIASNNIGCRDSLTKPNFIQSIVPPKADFQIDPSATISIPHYTFSFLNLTVNNPLYKYQWDLDDGTVAFTRDVLQHQYADTGSYAVQLIVIDTATRCLDTIVKIARIEGYPGYLFVPNAFYPNSLQTQFRSFKPLGKGLAEYVMEIYDNWGKLLFRTDKLDAAGAPVEGWDGTFKGQAMPQDAYAWRIQATFRNGIKWSGMKYNQNENGTPGHTFGTVTLFR